MPASIKKNSEKVEAKGTIVVLNDRGLHTRPSTEIVKCASNYKAEVRLTYHEMEVNAKSLLGILMLAAARGAKIRVTAFGEDAEEAVAALVALAKKRFHMNY